MLTRICAVSADELHATEQMSRLATNGMIAFIRADVMFNQIIDRAAIKNAARAISGTAMQSRAGAAVSNVEPRHSPNSNRLCSD